MARVGSPDEIISEPTAPKRDPDSTRSNEPTQDTRGVAKDRGLGALRLEATPEPTPAAYSFDMRGQWEGTVTDVGANEFSVVLCDIFNPGAKEYDAVFSLEEVADEDRDLLKEGAILYWTIGYEQRGGQRRRISEVRLRRLPAWSRADLARVDKASRELDDLFAR